MMVEKHTDVENDAGFGSEDTGTVLYVVGCVVLGILLGLALVPGAWAQEGVGLEDVPQKELTGLPVKEGGVFEQTWNWFLDIIGVETIDTEVVKRSILEQDLDIDDTRLVDVYDTAQGYYQVIVTPTETYDVPDKTMCYEDGEQYVCESTLRCDGFPGIEYGCEHVIVKKEPALDGSVKALNVGNAPIRTFVSRKEAITSPDLIVDAGLVKRLPADLVDSVKASIVPVSEVAVE